VDTTSRVFDKIELDELMVVMNTYPDNHRTILKYYFLNELNSCEIAEIVPESAFNVRKVVQRFRNKVKETHGG
jgi:DNA-directed RNA polymerase specialized sigma24 family protein